MFCKSGILIFIFTENNHRIYAHTILIKTPLLHHSFGPRVFLSLSHTLFLWSAEPLWVHFPAWASTTLSRRHSAPSPHQEGAWGLREQSKPRAGALLAFCINQGISASFSLLYFLIIDSRPPGSGPLMDLNNIQYSKCVLNIAPTES